MTAGKMTMFYRKLRQPAEYTRYLIKLTALLVLAWGIAACDVPAQGALSQNDSPALASDDVIAILDENAPRERIVQAATKSGYRLLDTTPLPALDKVLLTFALPPSVTGQDAIRFLEAVEPAATVGVNHAYRLQVDARRVDPLNYAQAMMQWPANGCRARMPVGVIDTAIDPQAPGVRGARVVSRSFGGTEGQARQHGTDIASILAHPDRLQGLTIYNASVMTQRPNGDLVAGADALILALEWMASQNVRVINMSLAGPFNKILAIAVDAAAARGLILVASVGNSGANAAPAYPAAFDPVIAATAVDADGQIYRRAVRGSFVDVAAPGVDIFVPSADGGRFVTGTSFAAAFVTARIAADPRGQTATSSAAVRDLLVNSASDLGPMGVDRTFGAGLLKAPQDCR
ncbi:MAG: S8 family serine peptidase [Ruegeria sp.]